MSEVKPPFVRRVVLRDYKSIRECGVALRPLTLLVGLNGSGKSNFLDALRFVSDALRTNLRNAVEQRGEVREMIRRGKDEPKQFSIALTLALSNQREVSFRIVVSKDVGLPIITEEHCSMNVPGQGTTGYVVKQGQAMALGGSSSTAATPLPRPRTYELFLPMLSGHDPGLGELLDQLRGMRFFNINPERIRNNGAALGPATELAWDGHGAGSTLRRILQGNREVRVRLDEYLRQILPTSILARVQSTNTLMGKIDEIHRSALSAGASSGEPSSVWLVLDVGGTALPFSANSISDGTLRAFGVLLALFQAIDRPENDPMPVVGIEEPEASVHPAAAGVLWDAMSEASHFTQVLATTHSVELLDRKDVGPESLLVVEMVDGESRIGPVDQVGQSIIRDRLATPGELLRQNQLVVEQHAAGADSARVLQP
jgi:predicted ATPase